jgi:hypothetical protein
MDSNLASALGISGITLSVVVAVSLAIARGLRSRCVFWGITVDMHPATQAELSGAAAAAPQEPRESVVVNVHPVTPAPHDEHAHETTHTATVV